MGLQELLSLSAFLCIPLHHCMIPHAGPGPLLSPLHNPRLGRNPANLDGPQGFTSIEHQPVHSTQATLTLLNPSGWIQKAITSSHPPEEGRSQPVLAFAYLGP